MREVRPRRHLRIGAWATPIRLAPSRPRAFRVGWRSGGDPRGGRPGWVEARDPVRRPGLGSSVRGAKSRLASRAMVRRGPPTWRRRTAGRGGGRVGPGRRRATRATPSRGARCIPCGSGRVGGSRFGVRRPRGRGRLAVRARPGAAGPSAGSSSTRSFRASRSTSRSPRRAASQARRARTRAEVSSSAGRWGSTRSTSSGRSASRAHSSFIRQTAGSAGRRARHLASKASASARSPVRIARWCGPARRDRRRAPARRHGRGRVGSLRSAGR